MEEERERVSRADYEERTTDIGHWTGRQTEQTRTGRAKRRGSEAIVRASGVVANKQPGWTYKRERRPF